MTYIDWRTDTQHFNNNQEHDGTQTGVWEEVKHVTEIAENDFQTLTNKNFKQLMKQQQRSLKKYKLEKCYDSYRYKYKILFIKK